jgi:hydroxymethylpyrimidine/phosphomethylpyrimidine kinase
LAAGGGAQLSNYELMTAIKKYLLPLTTVFTPNSQEARQLSGHNDLGDCGRYFLSLGAKSVLITGTHEDTLVVENRLFMTDGQELVFHWERLPHHYHGSGCTLASAIAGLLAQGLDLNTAINEAQDYTWQALQSAYQPGKGQYNPNRLFWMES